jgi:hypothetical protein
VEDSKEKRCTATQRSARITRPQTFLSFHHVDAIETSLPTSATGLFENMERTTASLSVHEIATIMSAALGAPPAPPLGCLRLLLGCWQAFTDGRYPQILTDHADLISLWMRFISTTCNMNEFSELNQSLHTCRCQGNACLRSAPEDLHSHFRDSKATPQLLVALMCETMCWPWAKRLVTLYRSRVRSAWPRSIHDLVPSDVDSVVFMLLFGSPHPMRT